MTNPDEKSKEIRQREQELEERERAIRLRELESEIYQQDPPLYYPKPDKNKPSKLKRWYRKAINIAKFAGFVMLGIAAVQLGAWIAGVAIVGGLGWFGYKLFLDSKGEDEE